MSTLPTRCPHCRGHVVESDAAPPHYRRLDCGECGSWLAWVPAPMTRERAEAMTMPFGKHRGLSLGHLAVNHPGYLEWLASSGAVKGSMLAAVRLLLGHADVEANADRS